VTVLGAERAQAQAPPPPPGQFLPPVNLGFTSFVDGAPPAGPGFYFQQYLQYWTADKFRDEAGETLPLLGDLDAWISLSQGIYQSDQAILFGGKWGIDVIVPFVYLDIEPGPIPALTDNGGGLGDVLVGPYLQWDPIMGEKGPIFVHRIELQTLFPTGKYDDDKVLNPGANVYSFNPYWSGTLFLSPHLTASVRLHYLWNSKNDDPHPLFGAVDDTQPGQAIHLNFASALEVLPKRLRVGINGYYLKQITYAERDGHKVSGLKERVLGIGPGAVWHFSRDDHFFVNLYVETFAEYRPEGLRLNLRYTHHF
jgi:anthranilate 1,2-dioxygenase (deaminating, decarboxylating) large subunit